jgi:molybdenum-dependent DNA-binding transcriptional regulator ModE
MASNLKLRIHFTPVPVRPRDDGWTAERRIAFIEKLADCGSVTAAARHVGMRRESARRLRRRCPRASRAPRVYARGPARALRAQLWQPSPQSICRAPAGGLG